MNIRIKKTQIEDLLNCIDYTHEAVSSLAKSVYEDIRKSDEEDLSVDINYGKILVDIREKHDIDAEETIAMANIFKQPIFMSAAFVIGATTHDLPNSNLYSISEDFQKKLMTTNIKNLRIRDISLNQKGYILLPHYLEDTEGSKYRHVYFVVGNRHTSKVGGFRTKSRSNVATDSNNSIAITFVGDTPADSYSMRICMPVDTNMPIQSFIDSEQITDEGFNAKDFGPNGVFQEVFKIIAYINSGAPDIREFRNVIKGKVGGKKYEKSSKNLSTLPLKIVGYNWKKTVEVAYSANSWSIKGHTRWQRYGPGLVNVKLIWIDETVGTRRKDKLTSTE